MDLSRREFLHQTSIGAVALGYSALTRSPGIRVSRDGLLALENDLIRASWDFPGGRLTGGRILDKPGAVALPLPRDAFQVVLPDGGRIVSSEMQAQGEPRVFALEGDPRASRYAEQLPGRGVALTLADREGRLQAEWRAILRRGSRYLRQEVRLEAVAGQLPVREIVLVDAQVEGASVAGSVRGSPVVAGSWFLGMEHPLSTSTVETGRVRCFLPRELPLRPGAPAVLSSVIGVARSGQQRRDFLGYLERERAHPYRPFLHYNSWYDLGYFSKYDEVAALAVIAAFGTELHRRRNVVLDSFLFDDGWDDPASLWHFHAGFPDGFEKVQRAAASYGAAPGVWLSPWGGYGKPRQERVAAGQAQGYEVINGGFALSGPRYYERFHQTCLDMIRQYGVNQFKFDGTGNASHVIPGSAFDSDFDAMLALIADLRRQKPDIYINLTTGTYPSPFFLRSADSIWRGGEDHDFAGVGTDRQRWITYRDADTWAGIVQKGPLFPLNSLMLHGLIFARSAHNLSTDPAHDFADEVRAYFGTGTQLQEMYITPSLLGQSDWDVLAEGARWARANAGTLLDSHWVGGDPARLEPYGHAAWSPGRSILVLRNPSDRPQTLAIDLETALELPQEAPCHCRFRSPWHGERGRLEITLEAGTPHPFELAPFQVLTLQSV